MKKLEQFCAAVVLTLALTFSASAGEMAGPGVTSSTPQQQSSVTGEISFLGATATGDMSTPGAVALDPVTEAALSLLQSLMSLF